MESKFNKIYESIMNEDAPVGAMSSGPLVAQSISDPKTGIFSVFKVDKNDKTKIEKRDFKTDKEAEDFIKANSKDGWLKGVPPKK